MTVLLFALSAFLGGSVASFLGVLAERSLRGESINGRSHCACGRPLHSYENVPVFGWLRTRGVAKCCGAKLPARYVLSEAALAVVYAPALWVMVQVLLEVFPTVSLLYVGVFMVAMSYLTYVLLLRASRATENGEPAQAS